MPLLAGVLMPFLYLGKTFILTLLFGGVKLADIKSRDKMFIFYRPKGVASSLSSTVSHSRLSLCVGLVVLDISTARCYHSEQPCIIDL